MSKISTRNLDALPDIQTLKTLCKALATLDAIICPDWEYRYYSYNKNWDAAKGEALFSMRNGSGDEFQFLFSNHGAIINGFAHESKMSNWTKKVIEPQGLKEKIGALFGKQKTVLEQNIYPGVIDTIPGVFREFITTEPIKSTGTTFCIWRETTDNKWNTGNIKFPDTNDSDGSEDLLYILDNKPETYKKWATEYYEEQFEDHKLKLELVKHIYDHKPITPAIAKGLNPALDEFETLKTALEEIGYLYEAL